MEGRKVTAWQDAARGVGTVEKWEPCGAGMCDALVRFVDGYACWYGSHCLSPVDGAGPLPSRAAAIRAADEAALSSLLTCRAQHVADFHKPWRGMEFAKSHVGQMLDGAIMEVRRRRGQTI